MTAVWAHFTSRNNYSELNTNGLTTLPEALFAGLTSLDFLYGAILHCTDERMCLDVPVSSELDRNDLSVLPEAIFSGLVSLADLYVHVPPTSRTYGT